LEEDQVTTIGKTLQRDALPNRTSVIPRASAAVPWILVLIFALSNIAILLFERVHDAAFDVVAAVVSVAGPGIANAMLARSATNAKTRAVEGSTKQLQAERAGLLTKNMALHAEVEAVKASKAALSKEHDALRATAAKRASAVNAMATRTSAVLATRSAEAVASLPVRAAPYVGIAALVSFTAVELKSDCNVAKALAELNVLHGNAPVDTGQVCAAISKVPSPQHAWDNVKTQAGTALRTAYDALESLANRLGLTPFMQH
jgi:hypothetical protein